MANLSNIFKTPPSGFLNKRKKDDPASEEIQAEQGDDSREKVDPVVNLIAADQGMSCAEGCCIFPAQNSGA